MLQNRDWSWLKTWEAFLALILVIVIIVNSQLSEFFFGTDNLINVFQLSIEKVIVAIIMTLIIINGEIDLSVASMMGFAASLFAWLFERGVAPELAILITMIVGVVIGLFNGVWVAYFGLPSLAVTLAGLVGYRGAARILLEDRSVGDFPAWFDSLGQPDWLGPFSAGIVVFAILFVIFAVILHYSAFGRYVYIIGNSRDAARYAGVRVRQVKMILFVLSATISSLAGLLIASRLGSVRANQAEGFELDIITIVLLGGVSIFGGRGTIIGVGLSILVVLNLRNGMGLANYGGNIQTSVVGTLLILSVLIPNMAQYLQRFEGFGRKQKLSPSSSSD
ncbi:MAG: ABC transporter permease [Chloroflexi bacterium]|nr:MAG: ATPase [Phototrophicales bacterium]RMF80779.1 MAG: ABC transporter permease [Chloroflexota bacterium]